MPVFANSAWVAAPQALLRRGGAWRRCRLRVRYGLCLHPIAGPVLIDTGYTEDATAGTGRGGLLRLYSGLLRPDLAADGKPGAVLARFGLQPRDVTHVIVTHFHADHVSGLSLFPAARVIACGSSLGAIRRRGALGNLRHGVFAELLPADLETRLAPVSDCARTTVAGVDAADLFGDGSLLAVDLPGHAEGQFGLAFPHLDPPVLYAVDAQWVAAALAPGRAPGFPASLVAQDRTQAEATTALVRRFRNAGWAVVLCHDPDQTPYDLPQAAP